MANSKERIYFQVKQHFTPLYLTLMLAVLAVIWDN